MKGTVLLGLTAAVLLGSVAPVEAQKRPVRFRTVGLLTPGSPSSGTDAFLQGLKELGYVEGENIAFERRFAEGKEEGLADLAADLVRLKVDVIVVGGTAAARAVRRLSKTIPIVIPDSADPVAAGLVATLGRPGGNITGLTIMSHQLSGKRLELLKETLPRISRMAILIRGLAKRDTNFTYTPFVESRKQIEITAQSLGVQIHVVAVREANEIDRAISDMTKRKAEAFILIPNPLLTHHRKTIVDLASKNRLPAIYPHRGFVEAGGLMSYAANNADLFHRAATYVDKILNGADPANLPVERPTKFELVFNLQAAKKLNIKIPPEVLMWADEVIQ